MPFTRKIELENVTYRYPTGDRPVVSNIQLEIPRGARVGFIGPTGSGKSTIIDLTLGLLQPTTGRVLIDGHPLASETDIRRWQSNIGYVPQHIFIADDTIAANIAFGMPEASIDQEAVERAARAAQVHDFIVQELPEGYDTAVGERGIRLSGGQRQRLGLARALYGDPAVLVLDEATSALDTDTERAVMVAIEALKDCTVIMIAHRMSTVNTCDTIFRIENGRIVKKGPSDELLGAAAAG
jgi:ABC-type bacteriocin/lantibiotic exporter with double-glycine peptidase domain